MSLHGKQTWRVNDILCNKQQNDMHTSESASYYNYYKTYTKHLLNTSKEKFPRNIKNIVVQDSNF